MRFNSNEKGFLKIHDDSQYANWTMAKSQNSPTIIYISAAFGNVHQSTLLQCTKTPHTSWHFQIGRSVIQSLHLKWYTKPQIQYTSQNTPCYDIISVLRNQI